MSRLVVYRRLLARRTQRWRWRLIAANGRKVANGGEGYANRNDALGAARAVISGAYADANTIILDN